MPISPIVLQRRHAELGRIRLGQKITGTNRDGKTYTRPDKLDRFRFTSVSEQYVRDLATLYGGDPQPWDNNGIPSWEVITTTTSIPVIVVKGGLSQWMEFWSGGGCIHRCEGGDGAINLIIGDPCDHDEQVKVGRKSVNPHAEARPTTRLSVMLPELEAVGVFRMETHGWNAAAEIPAIAELAQFVGELVPAVLHLVERRTVRDGETSRFVVPVLDLQIGRERLREVVAAKSGMGEIEAPGHTGAAAIEGPRPNYAAAANDALDVDTIRDLWKQAQAAGHLDPTLKTHLTTRVKEIEAQADDGEVVEAEVVDEPAQAADTDQAWQECMSVAGDAGISLWDLEDRFAAAHQGVTPDSATAEQIVAFTETLRSEQGAA